MYIVLIVILLIFLIVLIPLKISIDYEYYSKDYNKSDEQLKREIKIYILRFFKIKTIKKRKKEENNKNKNKNKKNNKSIYNIISIYKKIREIIGNEKTVGDNSIDLIKQNIKYEKIELNIEYNTKNYILNSYIMAILNYYINSYIAKNVDRFKLGKTKYNISASQNLLKIKFKSIVNLNLANTIYIILKLIVKYMKGGNNNGKKTSDRGFDVNSYDFT